MNCIIVSKLSFNTEFPYENKIYVEIFQWLCEFHGIYEGIRLVSSESLLQYLTS